MSTNNEETRYCYCCKPTSLFIKCYKKLPILRPFGPFRIVWDIFILVALIYTSIEIPLTLSFDITLSLDNALGIIAFAVDLLLLCDVILNFRTAYFDKYDQLRLVIDPFLISKRYLARWFWLDLFTSIPLEFMVTDSMATMGNMSTILKTLRIFRLLRILKILRLIRLMKLFDGFSKQFVIREVVIVLKLVKVMGAMIITAHYFACLWWYVGDAQYVDDHITEYNEDGVAMFTSWIEAAGIDMYNDSLFTKYSYAWYWSIVTLFTTGYGDITAHNTIEQWVCSLCILIGSCFFAYFIGTLTQLIGEGDRIKSYELQKVEEAQAFCDYYKFNRKLTRKILTHIRYYCNYNYVFDTDEIVSSLPPFLAKDIEFFIAKRRLNELEIFNNIPKEVIGKIALTMHSISCNANQYLYRKGNIAQCLYIQRTGESVLKYGKGKDKRRVLGRGDVIGELSLIYGERMYSVKCTTWSEFYLLDVSNIKQIFLQNFKPDRSQEEWRKIRHFVANKFKNEKQCISKCKFKKPTKLEQQVADKTKMIHTLSLHNSVRDTKSPSAKDDDDDTIFADTFVGFTSSELINVDIPSTASIPMKHNHKRNNAITTQTGDTVATKGTGRRGSQSVIITTLNDTYKNGKQVKKVTKRVKKQKAWRFGNILNIRQNSERRNRTVLKQAPSVYFANRKSSDRLSISGDHDIQYNSVNCDLTDSDSDFDEKDGDYDFEINDNEALIDLSLGTLSHVNTKNLHKKISNRRNKRVKGKFSRSANKSKRMQIKKTRLIVNENAILSKTKSKKKINSINENVNGYTIHGIDDHEEEDEDEDDFLIHNITDDDDIDINDDNAVNQYILNKSSKVLDDDMDDMDNMNDVLVNMNLKNNKQNIVNDNEIEIEVTKCDHDGVKSDKLLNGT